MNNPAPMPNPKPTFKRGWLFIIIAIAGLCVLSFASSNFINQRMNQIYQESEAQRKSATDDQLYTADKQLLIEGSGNTWNTFGAAQPKITIVEFGDFTCSYCDHNFPIVRAMMIKYQDSVQFIFRDRTPTARSVVLALAAHCAGAQGKFWPMHDKLYQNQSDTLGNNTNDLVSLAQSANLDIITFQSCLKNQTYLDKVKQNMISSINLGIEGTPTFYINGQKYVGELTEADFETIIQELK